MIPIYEDRIYVIDLEVRPLPQYENSKFSSYQAEENEENQIEVDEPNFLPWCSEIYGIGLAWGNDFETESAYFMGSDIYDVLKIISDNKLQLGAHNVLFDWLNAFYHFELPLNFVVDSGVISQCINNSDAIRSFGLKQTTERLYNVVTQDFELKEYLKLNFKIVNGSYGKYIHLCPSDMIEKYCRLDAHYCWRIINDKDKWLRSDISLYMKLHINEVKITLQQFISGIKIDRLGFETERDKLKLKLTSIKDEFMSHPELIEHIEIVRHKLFLKAQSKLKTKKLDYNTWKLNIKTQFNINSGDQLKMLFDSQKLHWSKELNCFKYPYINTFPNTKISNPNSPKLGTKFLHEYGVGGEILGNAGELKTLCQHIERALDEASITGRIHPHINLLGTASGRISASGVNIIATPLAEPEYGKHLIADDGWVILAKDYSSLEPTILACLSGDPVLQYITFYGEGNEPFIKDNILWIDDMYTSVAYSASFMRKPLMNVLNLKNWTTDCNAEKDKYKSLRKSSKTMSLSTIYGAGPFKVQQKLREDMKIYESLENIKEFQKAYWATFSVANQFRRQIEAEAKTKGYLINIGGFPLIFYDRPGGIIQGTHKALNRMIQSTAAFIMKLFLYYFYEKVKHIKDVKFALANHHDAFWAYCKKEIVEDINLLAEEALVSVNNTLKWPLKLRMDKNIGNTFFDCK